ncbi:MAG: hypothetical protein IJ087_00225 [Eggerthellaceae bacterium]|nr:hypothetical protein [Eggerthellaceae bacterium]
MVETIFLKTPILIDGERVRELSYDIDEISAHQFIDAENRAASRAMMLGTPPASVAELDAGFHVYLGIMAVIAVNPGYTVEDIERVKGPDVTKLMKVGRNFMTSGAEEDEEEDFDEPEDETEAEPYLQERE